MKRRGSRGSNWQRLTIQWRIALPLSTRSASKNDQARMRLTAFLEALETGRMPRWARISYLAWQNPDANWEPEPIINENEASVTALESLNKGGWLAARVRKELDALGGPLEPKASKPVKRKKRKAKAPHKKLENRRKKDDGHRHARKPSRKKK